MSVPLNSPCRREKVFRRILSNELRQTHLSFPYYFIYERIMCVMVNFYGRGHFVMPIME